MLRIHAEQCTMPSDACTVPRCAEIKAHLLKAATAPPASKKLRGWAEQPTLYPDGNVNSLKFWAFVREEFTGEAAREYRKEFLALPVTAFGASSVYGPLLPRAFRESRLRAEAAAKHIN
jgi:hypothetical protein